MPKALCKKDLKYLSLKWDDGIFFGSFKSNGHYSYGLQYSHLCSYYAADVCLLNCQNSIKKKKKSYLNAGWLHLALRQSHLCVHCMTFMQLFLACKEQKDGNAQNGSSETALIWDFKCELCPFSATVFLSCRFCLLATQSDMTMK